MLHDHSDDRVVKKPGASADQSKGNPAASVMRLKEAREQI